MFDFTKLENVLQNATLNFGVLYLSYFYSRQNCIKQTIYTIAVAIENKIY